MAEEEARALTHEHVGTEHLLLGLLREEQGLAVRVLNSLQITLERVREQVAKIAGPDRHLTAEQVPLTLQAKEALERALALGHNYIGTEHILLGLLQEEHGGAVRILLELGASSERVRSTVLESLSAGGVRRLGPESV